MILGLPSLRLGVDLGGTSITAVLCGDDGVVRGLASGATGDHADPGAVLDRVLALAHAAMQQNGVHAADLVGAGVGLPGEVDVAAGLFRSSPILPTWKDVPVAAMLAARLGRPVGVENDANATLLGEWAFGAGQGADPVLLLTLGTGIGGAILVNGQLIAGHRGSAGEVGHLSVDNNGALCWCGNRGCLGNLASATALVENYRRIAGLGPDAIVNGVTVAAALAAGDPAADEALELVCDALARGIAGAAVVLAPQRVVLFGGILAGLGDALIARVSARLALRAYPAVVASLELVAATLGPNAGAIGASLLPPWEAP